MFEPQEPHSTPSPTPLGMFVGRYLTYSETFIYDQLCHQERFRALVCAYARGAAAALFPYRPVVCLGLPECIGYLATGRSFTFTRALRSHGARLIHAHFGTNGAYAASFARRLDIPLAVTFHGHDVGGLLQENRFALRYARYQMVAPRMFQQASLLLCASQELADTLITRVGAPEDKIRVHRLGVDLSRLSPAHRPERPPRILMIGRLVEKKGFDYGLRAVAEVRRRHPHLGVTVVGDGPLRKPLEDLVQELSMEGVVDFRGVLPQAGVMEELAAADVLMAPSVVARDGDRESGVIVIKEAAATGLPTVGTRHGGIPEIIDDEVTGYLVPERQVGPLAERLERLVADRSLRRSMGRAARQKIERDYDTEIQNRRLETLLASVL